MAQAICARDATGRAEAQTVQIKQEAEAAKQAARAKSIISNTVGERKEHGTNKYPATQE